VDLERITWVLSGDEHVAEWQRPPNVVPIEPGRTLEALLVSGEIPAAIGVQVDSPDVEPLIPDPKEAGWAALRERGLYPINHTVVVKDELLDANPDLAADLYNAFVEAKRPYLDRLAAGGIEQPTGDDAVCKRVMEITGSDPLPYGIEANRRMVETIVQFAVEQGIIPAPVTVESLFAEIR
jgi:4,5-dihydroxyphthalate decarboxylase